MSDTELVRLERRLRRERAARREAEAIAERSTRELYDRTQELILLAAIAAVANGADTVEHGLGLAVERACRHLEWPVGQAWILDPGDDVLRLVPAGFIADREQFGAFADASAMTPFAAGEGLPGRVLASGEPVWLDDAPLDPNFPRAALATAAGLHTGVAFPVLLHGRTVAVIECFSESVHSPGPGLVGVLGQIGEQLARMFERAATEAQLRHEATHDPLTGLPNRTLFSDRVAQSLAWTRRHAGAVAIALIDLDRFKEVNDTLGHAQGDRLLIEVGARLAGALRESDTIARLGGDEFGLVLPDVGDADGAVAAAERVRAALSTPFALDGVVVQVDASVGVALYPTHGTDAGTLLRQADVAMYEAKRSHSGHFLYRASQDPYSPDRLGMVAALRYALEHGELSVHYQPKVQVDRPRTVTGAEALIRWPHPTRGLVPPTEFIALAEHTGLIRRLTTYVLRAAMRQAREWLDEGFRIPIAVNVSARSLLDPGFPDEIAALLAEHELAPQLIEIEVTESAMLEDPEQAMALLQRLSAFGIAIAIDDFGTGYSSLAQLKQLPVNDIKIDRSFVGSMLSDERDAFIVRSTIKLGHDLGLRVIAEGVEDHDTLDRLHELGCDTAQGFLIQRPVPAEQLTRWLHEQAGPVPNPVAAA